MDIQKIVKQELNHSEIVHKLCTCKRLKKTHPQIRQDDAARRIKHIKYKRKLTKSYLGIKYTRTQKKYWGIGGVKQKETNTYM